MAPNLDRFDRMEIAAARSRAAIIAPTVLRAEPPRARRPPPVDPFPAVTRPPRFVDHTTCPMCGVDRIGVKFQGLKASGAKIHDIPVHSPGKRMNAPGEPRCLGSEMRMAFVDGKWIGEAR